MRRLAILMMVTCLAADIATPLMRGAFRFNPDESDDGVRPAPARVVAPKAG